MVAVYHSVVSRHSNSFRRARSGHWLGRDGALERLCQNPWNEPEGQNYTGVTRDTDLTTTRPRTRITKSLRARVVEMYVGGTTSRIVAHELDIGKSTVLKILKESDVERRPQGAKYQQGFSSPNWFGDCFEWFIRTAMIEYVCAGIALVTPPNKSSARSR